MSKVRLLLIIDGQVWKGKAVEYAMRNLIAARKPENVFAETWKALPRLPRLKWLFERVPCGQKKQLLVWREPARTRVRRSAYRQMLKQHRVPALKKRGPREPGA